VLFFVKINKGNFTSVNNTLGTKNNFLEISRMRFRTKSVLT